MPNLLAKGQALLQRLMKKDATPAGAVTYRRGDLESFDLTGKAWVGRTVFVSNAEGGAIIEFGDRDYLVPVADLVLNGDEIRPQIGDVITERIGAFDVSFSIQEPATGEPAIRYSDPGRTIWRVHCKFKEKVAASG
jgi:hypothetical protein